MRRTTSGSGVHVDPHEVHHALGVRAKKPMYLNQPSTARLVVTAPMSRNAGLADGMVDAPGEEVIDDGRARQEGHEPPVGGAVEDPADRHHEQPPADAVRHQYPADGQHDSEKGGEGKCREEHQMDAVVAEARGESSVQTPQVPAGLLFLAETDKRSPCESRRNRITTNRKPPNQRLVLVIAAAGHAQVAAPPPGGR